VLPDVLCKRRGILYFAGELARIIGPEALKDGNARVSILLRRQIYYPLAEMLVSGHPWGLPYCTEPIR
jgi:hypothetical protein